MKEKTRKTLLLASRWTDNQLAEIVARCTYRLSQEPQFATLQIKNENETRVEQVSEWNAERKRGVC